MTYGIRRENNSCILLFEDNEPQIMKININLGLKKCVQKASDSKSTIEIKYALQQTVGDKSAFESHCATIKTCA